MMFARRALVSAFLAAACSSAPEVETAPRPAPQPAPDGGGAPAAAPSGRGAGVLYRPAPLSPYLLQRRDSLTLQLPGGASQAQQFTRTAFLGVTVQGREPPYEVAIKLDSVRQEGGLVPPDSLHRAEGTYWVGSLSASGKLSDLQADRLSTIGDQIGSTLPTLFPALPPSGLEAGREWTDTAHRSLRADAFDATEQAITAYRAAPGDGGSITIQSRTTFQRTGTSGQATQPMEMTSGGIREGVYRFGSGAVLAGEGTDSAEITITIPAVGQTVPVSQRGRWRVEKLR